MVVHTIYQNLCIRTVSEKKMFDGNRYIHILNKKENLHFLDEKSQILRQISLKSMQYECRPSNKTDICTVFFLQKIDQAWLVG